MIISIAEALNTRLADWADRLDFEVGSVVHDARYEFSLSVRGGKPRIVLGHQFEAHLWLVVDDTWRADTAADDLESLLYEWDEYLQIAQAVLNGDINPPAVSPNLPRNRWIIADPHVFFRPVNEPNGLIRRIMMRFQRKGESGTR
ncbi:MAG: hypothetical protein J0I11_12780 [Actinobacteria bacterium]|nr:hypothetical protein [Actinomycetota bacterium]